MNPPDLTTVALRLLASAIRSKDHPAVAKLKDELAVKLKLVVDPTTLKTELKK